MKAGMILANNLKQYRNKQKLSQEELAARSDLSTRGYGKIERGEVHASLGTLDKLAKATGLTQAALLQAPQRDEVYPGSFAHSHKNRFPASGPLCSLRPPRFAYSARCLLQVGIGAKAGP